MAIASFVYDRILTSRWVMNPQESVYRSPMDSGLPKQIPRFTKTLGINQMTYLFTAAQYATFESVWWAQTSSFGSLWFDFVNPRTDIVSDGRIIGGAYQVNPYDICYDYFKVDMKVESFV